MKHLLIIIGFLVMALGFTDSAIGFFSNNFEIAFEPYWLICGIGLFLIVVHFIRIQFQDKLNEKTNDIERLRILNSNLKSDNQTYFNKIAKIKAEFDATLTQYSNLRTKNRETFNKFKDSQNQLNKCIKQISDLEAEKGKLKRQLQSANANFAKYKKKK